MDNSFINFMKDNGLSENTYKSYANDLKLFKKYYFDSYGEELTTLMHADIKMYCSHLTKNNISTQTINRKLAALKQYNLFLINEHKQNNIAILSKDYAKITKSMLNKTIPSEQEINKIKHFSCRDTKKPKRDFCFFILLIYGGIRESELVNLRTVDIKLNEKLINVIGKGNKFRQVVINNIMFDALSDYLEERNSIKTKNPYLFIGQKNINTKNPLNRNFCNRLVSSYSQKYNIKNLHPHAFRAYYCSNALHNAGYTIEQVANQAGHSSLNTTKGYLVTKQEDLIALSNKL